MNLTSNFDFCVEIGIASVKQIFHLAFKTEDRYPHNIGPLTRVFTGHEVTVWVRVLDDEDRPADLRFADPAHVAFSFPFDIEVLAPAAPDPSLSRIVLQAQVEVPALLTSWEEEGDEVLGLSFFGVTANDVLVQSLAGLPTLDADRFVAAIHSRYEAIQHVHVSGGNTLTLYDGDRDPTLVPPNAAAPFEIQATLEAHAGTEYLRVTAPIHVLIPVVPVVGGSYESYGRLIFYREVERTNSTVTVHMETEPAAPGPGEADLRTRAELDTAHVARPQIEAQLAVLAVPALNGFGPLTEPGFDQPAAELLLREEIAAYLAVRRYPVYSPKSGDREIELATPVGFLLVAEGVLAILLNRRDSSVADHAPDNFLDGRELALAVGRAKVDELIAEVIAEEFPGVNNGGHHISTDEGEATLEKISVTPSDPGTHDEDEGHLWVTGEAEVHIDCWPDPDVNFDGPIFLDAHREDSPEGCRLVMQPRVGDFDFDQSCCDVFVDLLIPIVGWVMLAVTETMIDEVGGELAEEIAEEQGRVIEPIPPAINGIAEVEACLEGLLVFAAGFVMPASIEIRRLGRSYEDLAGDSDLPRP